MRSRKFDPSVLDALLLVLRDNEDQQDAESSPDLFMQADRSGYMPGATAGEDAATWPSPPGRHQA
jgi:hypothetical protein